MQNKAFYRSLLENGVWMTTLCLIWNVVLLTETWIKDDTDSYPRVLLVLSLIINSNELRILFACLRMGFVRRERPPYKLFTTTFLMFRNLKSLIRWGLLLLKCRDHALFVVAMAPVLVAMNSCLVLLSIERTLLTYLATLPSSITRWTALLSFACTYVCDLNIFLPSVERHMIWQMRRWWHINILISLQFTIFWTITCCVNCTLNISPSFFPHTQGVFQI